MDSFWNVFNQYSHFSPLFYPCTEAVSFVVCPYLELSFHNDRFEGRNVGVSELITGSLDRSKDNSTTGLDRGCCGAKTPRRYQHKLLSYTTFF